MSMYYNPTIVQATYGGRMREAREARRLEVAVLEPGLLNGSAASPCPPRFPPPAPASELLR